VGPAEPLPFNPTITNGYQVHWKRIAIDPVADLYSCAVKLTGRHLQPVCRQLRSLTALSRIYRLRFISDAQAKVTVPAIARFTDGIFYIRVHNPGTASSVTVMVFFVAVGSRF